MPDTPWTDAVAFDGAFEGEVVALQAGGRDLALYMVDGEVFATDNACTHGIARLCDGFLEGYEIECPVHQGRFDVKTGKALCAPLTEDLAVYPVKIEGGRVWVELPD